MGHFANYKGQKAKYGGRSGGRSAMGGGAAMSRVEKNTARSIAKGWQ